MRRSLGRMRLQVQQFGEDVKGKPPASLAPAEQQFPEVGSEFMGNAPQLRQAVHDVRMGSCGRQRLVPGREAGQPDVGLVCERTALRRPASGPSNGCCGQWREGHAGRSRGLPARQVAGLETGIGRA